MFYDCVKETLGSLDNKVVEGPSWLQNAASTLKQKFQELQIRQQQDSSHPSPPQQQSDRPFLTRLGFGEEEPQPIVEVSAPANFRRVEPDQNIKDALAGKPVNITIPSKPALQKANSVLDAVTSTLGGKLSGLWSKTSTNNSAVHSSLETPGTDISGPSNVKHEGHMGLSKQGRLETTLSSKWLDEHPEWKKFLLEIGVKPAEMEDEKVIKEILSEATMFLKQNSEPPVPKKMTYKEIQTNAASFRQQRQSVIIETPPTSNPPPVDNASKPNTLRLEGASTQQRAQLRDHLSDFMAKRRKDLREDE